MKKLYFLKTMLLLCALVAGSTSVWAIDRTITVTYNSSSTWNDAITGTSWSNSYAEHRWTAASSDGNTVIYMGGKVAKQSSSLGMRYASTRTGEMIGNIDPSYDEKKAYKDDIPSGAVGAIPGKIKKIEVECSNTRGVYIYAGTEQIVGDDQDPTATDYYSVKSDKLTDDIYVEYDTEKTAYTYFAITGANSSYTGVNVIKITYEEASSDPSSDVAFTNETPSINFPATTTYSQVATTATGYTGTVTYEITANTAGASISGSTVTVTQEGSVTVKATASAVAGSFAASEASYTLTVTDTRADNELAFDESEQEVIIGEVLSAPSLTNPNSLTVTYSSEDETIATVDASGNVTGVAIGTTNIIATFDGNATYKAGCVSYSLTVKKVPFVITDGVFDFTQDEDYGSKLAKSGVKEQTSTWKAVNVTMYMAGRNCWYDVTDGSDNIRLYKADGTKAAGNITLSVPTGYFISDVYFEGATLNKMSAAEGSYTTASSNKSATWTGCANSIKFTASDRTDITLIEVYYAQGPATLTKNVTSAGWATYAPAYPVSFGSEEAYIITAADENTTTLTEVSSVPAGTPVLLKGSGDHTLTVVGTSTTNVSSNCLYVSDGSALSNDIYVLANGNYGVGFYLWTGTDAPSAGKIYMELPATTSREFFSLGSEASGIDTTLTSGEESNMSVYDLQGRRVTEPTRGLYIVNGKKVIIK